jgi:hypothetical protein
MEISGERPLGPAAPRLSATDVFTTQQAAAAGVGRHLLTRLTGEGSLRRVLKGVYVDAAVPDSIELRAKALSLVVPPTAVVTDRTAAWLRGVSVLAAGDHLAIPPISVVLPPGNTRVRAGIAAGGIRMLAPGDIETLHGIRVTTALRTAIDLGRLTPPDSAIAALDGLLRTAEFSQQQLLQEIRRFKGFRGVRQLRSLAPIADGSAESLGESVLRLRWIDAALPRPELQIPFFDEVGRLRYRGDLGCSAIRSLAEYDGEEFHSTAEQRRHDERRRTWLRSRGWVVVVVRKEHLYGPRSPVRSMLRTALAQARSRLTATG